VEAAAKAAKHDVSVACTPEEIFENPDIEAVLNLTIPVVHAEISLAALNAGKHVYSEKPFATELSVCRMILAMNSEKGFI